MRRMWFGGRLLPQPSATVNSPIPMPTAIVRCQSCGALLVNEVHADSGKRSCDWSGEAA